MAFTDLKIKDEDFKGKNIQSIDSDTVIGRAEELKRLFDAPAQEVLKDAVNALIDYLKSTGAGNELGTPELNEESGNTVAVQLHYLFNQMKEISLGSIHDGSIEDAKLSAGSGQIKESVEKLKKALKKLEVYAPHNALVRWSATLGEDDTDEFCFDYINTDTGACFADGKNGDLEFGVLPMTYGGTNNAKLNSAPEGAVVVKRISDSGNDYLGYTNTVSVQHGGTGATTAVNARANLGAAAADHTHANKTVTCTFNEERTNKRGSTIRYNPVTKTCFARIYFETKASLAAGESYQICTVPAEYTPTHRNVLACDGKKNASVFIGSDSGVFVRPYEDIPAGYDVYIGGFWFV